MKFLKLDNIILQLKNTKVNTLLLFIVFFSLLYMMLDDNHFSGVNFIKETIKQEVIKKKIEKTIREDPEAFYTINDMSINQDIDFELNKDHRYYDAKGRKVIKPVGSKSGVEYLW